MSRPKKPGARILQWRRAQAKRTPSVAELEDWLLQIARTLGLPPLTEADLAEIDAETKARAERLDPPEAMYRSWSLNELIDHRDYLLADADMLTAQPVFMQKRLDLIERILKERRKL